MHLLGFPMELSFTYGAFLWLRGLDRLFSERRLKKEPRKPTQEGSKSARSTKGKGSGVLHTTSY